MLLAERGELEPLLAPPDCDRRRLARPLPHDIHERSIVGDRGRLAAGDEQLRLALDVALEEDKTFTRMMGRLGENIEIIGTSEYDAMRAEQSEAYKVLVDELTGQ